MRIRYEPNHEAKEIVKTRKGPKESIIPEGKLGVAAYYPWQGSYVGRWVELSDHMIEYTDLELLKHTLPMMNGQWAVVLEISR